MILLRNNENYKIHLKQQQCCLKMWMWSQTIRVFWCRAEILNACIHIFACETELHETKRSYGIRSRFSCALPLNCWYTTPRSVTGLS